MNYGDRLRALRKRKRWSQGQVAKEMGVDRSTYTRWELAENELSFEILKNLAALFDTTIEYILSGKDEPKHPSPRVEEQIFEYLPDQNGERELNEFLEQQEVLFHGAPLSDADKRQVRDVLEVLFREKVARDRKKREREE